MKKRTVWIIALALLLAFSACCCAAPKATAAITLDELLAANLPEAIFSKTDSFCVMTKDEDDSVYITCAAMVDGKLIYAIGTEGLTDDLLDGVVYNSRGEDGRSITFIAPTADQTDLIEDIYGEQLRDYEPVGDISVSDGQYVAHLRQLDEDWGLVTEVEARFDAETLLITRVEITLDMIFYKYTQVSEITYGIGTDFAMVSYDDITDTEDQVKLFVHYPDGTVKELTVDRRVALSSYYPDHEQTWSVCWDEACTASVVDLAWVTGDSAHVYLCEGYIPDAPPIQENVIRNSSFEAMFSENYDSYYQINEVMDPEWNSLMFRELAWYMDDDAGLCMNFEIKDEEYNVVVSGRARDGAWYYWTAEDGYSVDFYDEFSYAEDCIKEYRLFIEEEKLAAEMELQDEFMYYIPYTENLSDGTVREHKYIIHSDIDCIERVEITHLDKDGAELELEIVYIGGNGPILGDKQLIEEVSEPSDVKAVKLTVVTAAGQKTYQIRKDAAISWKGEALYSDKECTLAVTDLAWVSGSKATVYAK